MTEIKDPLQTIQEALNEPIEAIAPTQIDDEAVREAMAARHRQIVFPPYSITRNAGKLTNTLRKELAAE